MEVNPTSTYIKEYQLILKLVCHFSLNTEKLVLRQDIGMNNILYIYKCKGQ